jgi:hypothetical protein
MEVRVRIESEAPRSANSSVVTTSDKYGDTNTQFPMTLTPPCSLPISPELTAELQSIASEFRRKLDAADKSILPEPFRDFPRGSCGAAAETLGIYIRETLGIECVYTNAGIPLRGLGTHTWLEYRNLIIDVTADQFGKPPILVTTDRSWHWIQKYSHENDRFPHAVDQKPFQITAGCTL